MSSSIGGISNSLKSQVTDFLTCLSLQIYCPDAPMGVSELSHRKGQELSAIPLTDKLIAVGRNSRGLVRQATQCRRNQACH
jgi:hypothetical protein